MKKKEHDYAFEKISDYVHTLLVILLLYVFLSKIKSFVENLQPFSTLK